MENTQESTANDVINSMNIDPDTIIDVYVDDKLFSVKMSGFFAKRLQGMANWILSSQDSEKVLASYEELAKDPTTVPTDPLTFNIQTLMILMKSVEECALEQGATEKSTFRKMQESVQDASELISKLDTGLDSHG